MPPDLREQMKTALRLVHVDVGRKRHEAKRVCKVAVARARRERNESLRAIDDEFARRREAVYGEFEAKAAERMTRQKLEGSQ
jgi:hypothetical protein